MSPTATLLTLGVVGVVLFWLSCTAVPALNVVVSAPLTQNAMATASSDSPKVKSCVLPSVPSAFQ
jgi:hypothetical protein